MNNEIPTLPFGTATLLDELDKKLMVQLRCGKTLIGYLRSVDQFANLVLHNTFERIHVADMFGDIFHGTYIVRGENVVLLGEIDEEKEKSLHLVEVSQEEILAVQTREQNAKAEHERELTLALKERGIRKVPDKNKAIDDMS